MVVISSLLFVAFSCSKDKTKIQCSNVSMTGERSFYVDKWRWYNTVVEQWFDVGPSNYLDYTPQNQGFEYYFTLSINGEYKGYRNDTLIHDFQLTGYPAENYDGSVVDYFRSDLNCTSDEIEFRKWAWYNTQDTIFQFKFPLNFNDEENHLISKMNYFVRE